MFNAIVFGFYHIDKKGKFDSLIHDWPYLNTWRVYQICLSYRWQYLIFSDL